MSATPRVMVFLTYTPRAGALDEGYHAWLRDVDNPFFNTVPGICHYSNWAVKRALNGNIPFTHFDFMIMESANTERVWSNPDVTDFAAGWTKRWGADPGNPDLSVNYRSCIAGHLKGDAGTPGTYAVLGLDPSPGAVDAGAQVWQVGEPLVGEQVAQRFGFTFTGDNPDDLPDRPDWAPHLALSELVAAPENGWWS